FNLIRGTITRDFMNGSDQFFSVIMLLGMTLVVIPTADILYTVFERGRKGLHAGLLTNDMAMATPSDPITSGGLLHAIIGTFLLVSVALILSVPIGILTALYLTEIKGRFTRPIRFLVQAMSGVPSIVAGLFILSSIVYTITKSYSGFVGSLALTILMIPTIARTAEEVLNLIPNDLREAGVALGGTQWRTVAMVVIPAARSGLITALILGVARIVGETAPILLLTGGGDAVNFNPTSGAMGSLPFYIWKSFLLGTEESITRGWAGLLVLLVLVLILFIMARVLGSRRTK
ncbi:MAG: phosphate ABC transporter permease PstA, partial [Burkholderiaceae bacterium]|nr:phosphate ABC transporter permease PstA [Burkholderiaceae bacterium]